MNRLPVVEADSGEYLDIKCSVEKRASSWSLASLTDGRLLTLLMKLVLDLVLVDLGAAQAWDNVEGK